MREGTRSNSQRNSMSTVSKGNGRGTSQKASAAKGKPVKSRKKAVDSKPASNAKMKKQYLKNNKCKVTFMLPKDAVGNAEIVSLAGDFNNWDSNSHSMTKLKNGTFSIALNLECGKKYQYRYLINNNTWENDWNADAYEPNPFGGDNSVIEI